MDEPRRRAKHTVRRSTRGRITVVTAIGRVLAGIAPGSLERRPQVWAAAIAAGAVSFALLLVRMFVPSTVGMGDDGDGFGLLCTLGLGNDRPFTADPALAVHPGWSAASWSSAVCPAADAPPFSAYFILVRIATALSAPFGVALDLRVLGVLLALCVAGLIVAMVRFLPGSVPFRLVIVAAVLLIVMDGVFVDLLIAPDIEGTAVVALLAAFVALLILWGATAERITTIDVPPRGVLATVLAVVLAALVLSVNPIGLAFLPGFVAGLLWVPRMRDTERARSRRTGRSLRGDRARERRRRLAARVPAIAACLVLLAVAAAQVAAWSARDRQHEVYDAIFLTILPTSPSPDADLEWFGLDADRGLGRASGQEIGTSAAADVLADPGFVEVGLGDIVAFQLAHPERLVAVADRGMTALAEPQRTGIGNVLDERVDEAGAIVHDTRWNPVLWGSRLLYSVPLLIPAGQIAGILVAISLATSRRSPVRARSLGWATLFLLVGGALVFWSALLSAQPDLAEVLLPTTFILWLSIPLVLACAALRFTVVAPGAAATPRVQPSSPGAPAQPPKSAMRSPMPNSAPIAAATLAEAPPSP